MILGEQENVVLLNLDFFENQNVYFDIIFTDAVYPLGEMLSPFTHFCFNQRFS